MRRLLCILLFPALLCAACASRSAAPEGTDLEARFFAAGAADAILLTTAEGAVLVDCGEQGFGKEILAYLEEKGVERLDYLIITHFDKDHVGGAAKVINNIAVGTVLQSSQPKDSEEYEKYVKALQNAGIEPVTVRTAYRFELDGVRYAVDPPKRTDYDEDASNNSSLIVSVQNGQDRFLLMGDAQTARLTEFLAAKIEPCAVLKVPHHGRDEPLAEELARAASPAYAVITSSEEEPESAATVAALESVGATVLLTREGAVTVSSDGAGVRVAQEE